MNRTTLGIGVVLIAVAAIALGDGAGSAYQANCAGRTSKCEARSLAVYQNAAVDGGITGVRVITFGASPSFSATDNQIGGNSTGSVITTATSSISLRIANTQQWFVNASTIAPNSDNAEDIGTTSARVQDIYAINFRDTGDVQRVNLSTGAAASNTYRSPLPAALGTGTPAHLFETTNALGTTDVILDINTGGSNKVRLFGGGDLNTVGALKAASYLAVTSNVALPTCTSAEEGRVYRAGGAASSAVRTKLCMCTSDGAASPVYAWKNISIIAASEAATIGTTTTCP